jgi:stage III sporulation protein AG
LLGEYYKYAVWGGEMVVNTRILEKLGLANADKKRILQLLAVLVCGLLLMAFSSYFSERGGNVSVEGTVARQISAEGQVVSIYGAEEALEDRLSRILSRIEGAGEVSVSLTFARSGETEYAVNASTTMRTTEENGSGTLRSTTEQTSTDSLVLADGNGSPVTVRETMPEVQGVLVVAEGGDNAAVCSQISTALQNLLAIPAHKIVICPAGK